LPEPQKIALILLHSSYEPWDEVKRYVTCGVCS